MASYYKYAERDVANEIDWRAITGEITQNMKDIEKAREDKRVAIQKASGDAMKRMMEKPQGEDFLENNRVANYAQQAQEIQLENLRLLKRGDISEREYSLRFNNLTTGTDMVFNLSQEYQDSYQMHMDRMKPDENGIVQASGIEGDMLGKAEQYGNPKDSQYYINPLTGEVNLALTKEDGQSGQVTIGDSQFDLMSLGTARNIIFQKVNKYQTQTQVKGLVEGLKTEVNEALGTGALKGYITKEKGLDIDGLFKKTKDGKLVPSTDESKAIIASINATFAGDDFSRASFLYDTVKTIDGEVVELVYPDPEGNFPELKNNQIKMVLNNQNRYVPEITDEQNRIIEKNMVGLIKNGIDKEFGITADTRMTDYQRFQVGKINRELREKKDSLQLRLDTISELYRGGDVDLQAATTFFRDIDPNIVEINRSDTGVAVTILDRETGEREIRDISFFGETDGEIDTNKPLDERDFIKAASNILLGKEAAESSEYLNLYNRKKKVGDEEVFVYDRKLRNEGQATADTSLSGGSTGRNTYSISTNKYIDKMLDSEALDFGMGNFQDNDLAKALQTQFADLGLKAEATGGISNEVFVTIPGVQERVIIDANNFTPSGIRGEKDKLRKFLATAIKKLKLEEKLNLEPDPNQGRFSKYN